MSYAKNILACLRCVPSRVCEGNVCRCPQDNRPIIDHAHAGDCPIGKHMAIEDASPATVASPLIGVLRKLWRRLHERAAEYPIEPTPDQIAAEREWLAVFGRGLPCGPCRSQWESANTRMPPDLSSRYAYFDWSVSRHNQVNIDLGKPAWTVMQAMAEYGLNGAELKAASKPL